MARFSINTLLVFVVCLFAALSNAQNSPKDFLAVHNVARSNLGVRPLSWNASVAAYAHNCAKSRLPACELEHSQGPFGENLAEGYGEFSAVDAVTMWIGEKPNYDHASNSCVGGECLHYTQVVWRDSVSLGCARVRCDKGLIFVTCNYYPPGNYIGESRSGQDSCGRDPV
uniref:SCP domain-containing protein n=1 Tax=Kalanchoe fedtschenkoi TaxID=63787 RepID=A0A7N1A1U1_KALFE